jgi:hypothetical protein
MTHTALSAVDTNLNVCLEYDFSKIQENGKGMEIKAT